MSIFKRHRAAEPGDEESAPTSAAAETAAAEVGAQVHSPFVVPSWMRQFGLAAWLLIGIVIVLLVVLSVISALRTLFVPTLFAALLGATFLPVTDRFERWGMRRGVAGIVVMLLIVLGGVAIVLIVAIGVFKQFPTVKSNLEAAADAAGQWLTSHNVSLTSQQLKSAVEKAGPAVVQGAVGTLVAGVQTFAALAFGLFIGLNILVWFLIQGRSLGRWASRHMSPVPQRVAYHMLADAARFLRGYIWGSTIIGLFNGGVMFVGALVLGVPLAATIGIVGWATNYVPMFGAIIGGAFAVIIALGSGGLTKAIAMLIVVIIANGSLQTVVSQFALGAALKLHPLAVLFATTAGAILFGAIGGVVAAPLLKIAVDWYGQLKEIGLFDEGPRAASLADAGGPSGAGGLEGVGGPGMAAEPPGEASAAPPAEG